MLDQLPVGVVPCFLTSTEWVSTTTFLTVLQIVNCDPGLESRCGRGPLLLEAPGKNHFLGFPSFYMLPTSLV